MNLILLFNQYVKLLLSLEQEIKKGNTQNYEYYYVEVAKEKAYREFHEAIINATGENIEMLLSDILKESEQLKFEIEVFSVYLDTLANSDIEEEKIARATDRLEYLKSKLQKFGNIYGAISSFANNSVYTLKLS